MTRKLTFERKETDTLVFFTVTNCVECNGVFIVDRAGLQYYRDIQTVVCCFLIIADRAGVQYCTHTHRVCCFLIIAERAGEQYYTDTHTHTHTHTHTQCAVS
jgi:hypothetical protein